MERENDCDNDWLDPYEEYFWKKKKDKDEGPILFQKNRNHHITGSINKFKILNKSLVKFNYVRFTFRRRFLSICKTNMKPIITILD